MIDILYRKRKQINASTRKKRDKCEKKLKRIIDEAIINISGLQGSLELTKDDKMELENDLIDLAKYLYVRLTGKEVIMDKILEEKEEEKTEDDEIFESDED
jgi:hypothetical protein